MRIDATSLSMPLLSPKPAGIVQPELVGGKPGDWGPPLTRSDLELIKAATNTEFDWPPREGSTGRFPQVAYDLGLLREQQMREGSVLKDFTNKDLLELNKLGVVDDAFLARALDYLTNGVREGDLAGRTDLTRSVAEQQAEKATAGRLDETGAAARVYL